jgi:hypothetical protein
MPYGGVLPVPEIRRNTFGEDVQLNFPRPFFNYVAKRVKFFQLRQSCAVEYEVL